MALAPNEQRDMRELLHLIFEDRRFLSIRPTEHTVEQTEEMLLEIGKCSSVITRLLASLPCGRVGKGFLRRCLKAVKQLMNENAGELQMCIDARRLQWKNIICTSGI